MGFIDDLKERWHGVALSCGVALILALGVSLALPKRYTATATILIGPPGGNDSKTATTISTVYLESLRSYERMALSDTLFAEAVEHVHVTNPNDGRSLESLKKSILRVNKPVNTTLLEISATTIDPKKAQALAQFIAERTVETSRTLTADESSQMTRQFRAQFDAAEARLAKLRQAEDQERAAPIEGLEAQLTNNADLLLSIDKDISENRTEIAGYKAEVPSAATDRSSAERLLASAEARLASLNVQRNELVALIAKQQKTVQDNKNRAAQLQAEDDAAQAEFETASTRLNDVITSNEFRGERLRLIDPGVVPQEPQSPNIPLNLLAALVLSLTGSLVFIGITPRKSVAAEQKSATLAEALM